MTTRLPWPPAERQAAAIHALCPAVDAVRVVLAALLPFATAWYLEAVARQTPQLAVALVPGAALLSKLAALLWTLALVIHTH